MSKAAFTVRAFGVYLVLLGVALVSVPNLLLGLFGIPSTSEVWIRVVGLLAFNIGVYYWYAAKSEARSFFMASVFVRAAVPAVFIAFVAMGLLIHFSSCSASLILRAAYGRSSRCGRSSVSPNPFIEWTLKSLLRRRWPAARGER